MKALFLIFHGFDKANGISKKIHYQVKALKECGVDARLCYYDITPHCERRLMIDNEVIADFGTGTTAKVWKRIYYAPIIKYARREKIEFVYIRSAHNANPFTLRLVKHHPVYETQSGRRPLLPPFVGQDPRRYRHFL